MPQQTKTALFLILGIIVITGVTGYFLWQRQMPAAQPSGAPDYKAPLHISAGTSADQRDYLRTQLVAVQDALNASTTDVNAWIALGVVRKQAGDYAGAEEVWNYTAARWPTSSVAFNNLGDLYMNYLKDYPKAEASYMQVITLEPDNINAYSTLYTLYRYLYKTDTSAAADILVQGLKTNPGNSELLALRAQLKAGQ